MALTGAFYPSIDLCAGEKERGTMETLLISPASRGEIVMGKFLTVVLASMTTAILNLLSMALTGLQLAYKLAGGSGVAAANFGPPTLMAAFWMIVLLVPLSVFFSAICVALAVLAKSMKEGQYYMTPLYMVSLPLILLTLAPGIELTPFYSMVPITGVGLLLKSLILGDYGSRPSLLHPGARADGRSTRPSPCGGPWTSSAARTCSSASRSDSTSWPGSATSSGTASRRRRRARRSSASL